MEHHCDATDPSFAERYQQHLKHLTLKGLQPKTVKAYSRAIRRMGEYFDQRIDDLSEAQLLEYFSDLVESHSWSTVKLDLYGLKFYYEHVLKKPWLAPGLIKPPRAQRLPDILTVVEDLMSAHKARPERAPFHPRRYDERPLTPGFTGFTQGFTMKDPAALIDGLWRTVTLEPLIGRL